MNTSADRLARLRPDQRALLELRLQQPRLPGASPRPRPDFSLFFFSADEEQSDGPKYDLVLEAARFADRHGLTAVWTPERHFHRFGGLYPSPAVLSAALAAVTDRIRIRAGSVVIPLQHPVRVAEEWSLIDNLSGGRVGVSFASGWSPQDFVFSPDGHADRREALFQQVDLVRRLWRGEVVPFRSGTEQVQVRLRPRPVQPELPCWVSSVGGKETCRRAGAIGANLLTALLRQTVDQVAEVIGDYRAARDAAGHDPSTGQVTVMLHTYLGESDEQVRSAVRGPLSGYLSGYLDLLADTPARSELPVDPALLSEDERGALVEHALERYLTRNGLFGTPASALAMVDRLAAAGVDEIACLVDFGLRPELVMQGLRRLVELRDLVAAGATGPDPGTGQGSTAAAGSRSAPLSPAQERLWFLDRLIPGSSAYHVRSAVRLRGGLDVPLLSRALREIERRHHVLRTAIGIEDGRPVQRPGRAGALELRVVEATAPMLATAVAAEAAQPFDLAAGPLARAALFRLAADDHVLTVTLHHLVADGWSVAVLHRELAALYGSWRADPARPAEALLPPLPMQYADVARELRLDAARERMRAGLDFWRGRLTGAPASLTLPTRRPRPARQTHAGAAYRFVLTSEEAAAVHRSVRRGRATTYQVLLACYAIVLAGHSGQRDLVIGCPIAGRTRPEHETLIGLFTTTVAQRVDLGGDPPFDMLLERVRQAGLDVLDHQDVPLELVIEALGLSRSAAHQPLFQAVLVMQSASRRPPELPGAEASRHPVDGGTAKFDLVLDVTQIADELAGAWEYSTDLFDPEDVEGFHADLVAVLAAAAADPRRRVEELCGDVRRLAAHRHQDRAARLRLANRQKLTRRTAARTDKE